MPVSISRPTVGLKFKPIVYFLHDPPIFDHWYTLLDCKSIGEVYDIIMRQRNDLAAAKDIYFRGVIDGVVFDELAGESFLDGEWMHWMISTAEFGDTYGATSYLLNGVLQAHFREDDGSDYLYGRPLPFNQIFLEYKITSALGTNQKLEAWCRYFAKG